MAGPTTFVLTAEIRERRRIAREPDVAAENMIQQRNIWPPGFLPADDTVLYNRIYWAVRSAREYGMTQHGAKGSWVFLGTGFLPYFWLTDTGRAYLIRPGATPMCAMRITMLSSRR